MHMMLEEALTTCHTRASARALRQVNKEVVIHGGRYYGTLLVIIESGLLYSVALVCTYLIPPLRTTSSM